MTTRPIDRRALIDWFVSELSKAQQERPVRQNTTDTGELEWIVFERDKLLELINLRRARISAPPVDMAAVERIENSAVGHSDYTLKLAIRAAELVLERPDHNL